MVIARSAPQTMKILLSLVCLILVGCSGLFPPSNTVPPPAVEPEEYSVYTALIQARYGVVVIKDQTDLFHNFSPDRFKQLQQQSPELDPQAFADFQQRNQQNYPLRQAFNLPYKPVLLSQDDFGKMIGADLNPENFRQAFPDAQGGYLTLSRAGFNPARTQAVVYAQQWKGPLDGTGFLYYLVKTNGQWTIAAQVMDYIS
jgi:hypothetical protein